MKKCYIITAYIEGVLPEIISPQKSDFMICADGGYEIAVSFNIVPDLVIGDSDSGGMQVSTTIDPKNNSNDTDFICFPKEKDVSDTFLCVQHAVNLGFEEIIIAGGIGGRLDHTISNIQTLAHFSNAAKRITMVDEKNLITVIENSTITLPKKDGFTVSLFSLSDTCSGVRTAGLYYPLVDAELQNTYPLGLSNQFTENEAIIEVKKGKLLIVMSQE